MKIVFTGGATGGHFYPLIAIAEAVHDAVRERHLLEPRLYYLAPGALDKEALFENRIAYIFIPAGKWRRYFSILNFFDIFVTLSGCIAAFTTLFALFPDVVISKGGFGSVPTVLAARVLGIPVIIHESDAKPGRANLIASKFAARIAVSFESSIPYFPEKVRNRIAKTGAPISHELMVLQTEGARQELGLDADVPTLLILGGSLGSRKINETVLEGLLDLVHIANIIHQTGKEQFTEVEGRASIILKDSPEKNRYHAFPYLNTLAMRRAAGAASLIASRAGAGAIAEIAAWRKPAILIPIPEVVSHDQRTNAYAYAHTGAAVVLEESNLTPHVLVSEAHKILSNPALQKEMGDKGVLFAAPEAARMIADEAIAIAIGHEKD